MYLMTDYDYTLIVITQQRYTWSVRTDEKYNINIYIFVFTPVWCARILIWLCCGSIRYLKWFDVVWNDVIKYNRLLLLLLFGYKWLLFVDLEAFAVKFKNEQKNKNKIQQQCSQISRLNLQKKLWQRK